MGRIKKKLTVMLDPDMHDKFRFLAEEVMKRPMSWVAAEFIEDGLKRFDSRIRRTKRALIRQAEEQ